MADIDTSQAAHTQAADLLHEIHTGLTQSAGLFKGRRDRARRESDKPVTIGAVSAVIDGDIFPRLIQLVEYVAQLRDGTAQAVITLESKIDALEDAVGGDETSILPEDAAVLRQVILDLREAVALTRTLLPEAKAAEYEAHAVKAEALLDASTMVDEGEGDEGEGDEGEDEANAAEEV